eukprot:TRINITY_DN2134_c0_g1_i1.p1 TRINITY_DN2134_c0_g1~~TRINITY_DN2134_c0_g1_i1.p1  ORF type:complete len:299 (+),score=20.88 TRINITY_DN2134_c0_g1_i1:69-899(+)
MAQPQVFHALVVMIAMFAGLASPVASAAPMALNTPGGEFTKGQVRTMGSKVRGPKQMVTLPKVPRMKLARTLTKDYETAVMNYNEMFFNTPKSIHPITNATTYAALAALNQVYKSWIVPLPLAPLFDFVKDPVVVVPKNRQIFITTLPYPVCWWNIYRANGDNITEIGSREELLSSAEKDFNAIYPYINIAINGVDVGVGLKAYPKPFTQYLPINLDERLLNPGDAIAFGRDTTCIGTGVIIEDADPGIHTITFTSGNGNGASSNMTLVVGPYFPK